MNDQNMNSGAGQGSAKPELAPLFDAVGQVLRQNQVELNQADPYNGNHGDHMIAIFDLARQAAQEKQAASMAEAMDYAADLLDRQAGNGSASVYGRGLRHMAAQFRHYNVDLDSLLAYVRKALAEDKENGAGSDPLEMAAGSAALLGDAPAASSPTPGASSADVLKALVNRLAGWAQSETSPSDPAGDDPKAFKLNMGALFEFGMAYLQAKQRGSSRADVLADAAASVSPLSQLPHRYESAKLAIAALLRAMQN